MEVIFAHSSVALPSLSLLPKMVAGLFADWTLNYIVTCPPKTKRISFPVLRKFEIAYFTEKASNFSSQF